MDFGYKVIRNRLGSLVANAIQKKIDSNKGGETLIVKITRSDEEYDVDKSSEEVSDALNKNIPITYICVKKNGTIHCTASIKKVYNSNTIQVNFIDPENESFIGFTHNGLSVETLGGG